MKNVIKQLKKLFLLISVIMKDLTHLMIQKGQMNQKMGVREKIKLNNKKFKI